nr:amino acid permease [Aristophania vespae]
MGLIVLALLLNALPVRLYGQSEALLSVLKLLTLALFMGIALYWVWHQTNAKAQITSHLFDHGGLVPFGIWSVFTVIPMIIQTFTGCEIAFVASPESTDPKDNIKQAVNRIPFIILIFYVGSILAILCLHPWTDIISGHSPFLLVMRSLSVPFAQTIVIIMTLMAIISCLNSSKYIVSRVLRELSELGCAPAQLNQSTRHNVPITALILSTSLEIIIILIASFSPSRGYAILLGASGNLIIFSYFMASLSRSSLSKYIARPLMSFLARISVLFMGGLLVILPFSSSTRLEGIIALCLIASLSVASLKLSRN